MNSPYRQLAERPDYSDPPPRWYVLWWRVLVLGVCVAACSLIHFLGSPLQSVIAGIVATTVGAFVFRPSPSPHLPAMYYHGPADE